MLKKAIFCLIGATFILMKLQFENKEIFDMNPI